MPAAHSHSGSGMRSQAQWRFLYATHKTFAHRWAEQVVASRGKKTGYHSLPTRKGARRR
jgi:hypothetical protein